ncbi:MAG: M1 family metallopeptidase [Terriglobales bacterium]
MPKVTGAIRVCSCLILMTVGCVLRSAAQAGTETGASNKAGPAETLYEQLRTVGLDSSRVYRVREASLDRASLHIDLDDGTIAFTQDVEGKVTGAFFAGDGEVLLSPPDQIERSSMALFTGAAILEERFVSAYLRFNDDTFQELKPFLRPADDPQAFVAEWNDGARALAEEDALRLFTTFSRLLPVEKTIPSQDAPNALDPEDRMLHLRIEGRKLGTFDLFFDLAAKEQISVGQLRKKGGENYYNVWTSFAFRKEPPGKPSSQVAGEGEDYGNIEVSRYKIVAEIKPPTELEAEASLEMLVRHGGDRAVLFELSRHLRIREVEMDGRPLEFIHNPALEGTQLDRRGNDFVAVVFPEPLQHGRRIDLHFSYGGAVLSDAGGGLLYVGARGTWYPSRGFSKSAFDIEFHYPAPWTLVATGKRTEGGVATAGQLSRDASPDTRPMRVSRWVSERPIPVAGFNLGKYARVTRHAGPVAVDVYAASAMENSFPQVGEPEALPQPPARPGQPVVPMLIPPLPPSPAGNAGAVAEEAVRALSFFSANFGPYPYSGLSVTQMPGSVSQGWPGLIFLTSYSFLSENQKTALHMTPVQKIVSDDVTAHETAHQWWGDLVTWSGYRDQWISEALANYSALLLLESQKPLQFRAVMQKYRDDLLQKNRDGLRFMDAGPVTLGTRLNSSKFPDGYETIAYERGTWLFHMLRCMMRDAQQKSAPRGRDNPPDDPFMQALHSLRERYQTKPISTAELMQIFAEHLPPSAWHEGRRSLDWFYQGWVNETEIPELELHSLKYADNAHSTIVTGIIKQKDASETLVTSVPLYASLNGRTVFAGRIFADGQETSFHLTVPHGTRRLLLDPDRTVLSRFH